MKILAKQCFDQGRLLRDQIIEVDRNEIRVVRARTKTDQPDFECALITPAFVDLQVNGGGGVLLNNNPTAEGVLSILKAHQARGTCAILPTLISDRPAIMDQAVSAILEIWGESGIMGIHIEGPHLNPEKKGTHAREFIRPLDENTMNTLKRLRARNIPVLLTLAPETVSTDMLRTICDLGVILSAGHSLASFEEALESFKNGVSCATHLYNAMPPMSARAPGLAGAVLTGNIHFGIIADGIHVSYPMIEIAYQSSKNAKGHNENMFIVSDAMATIGGADHFTLYDQTIMLEDGKLINNAGALAGAHVDLLTSLKNLAQNTKIPLETILHMLTINPLRAMKLEADIEDKGALIGRRDHEWLALDDGFEIIEIPARTNSIVD